VPVLWISPACEACAEAEAFVQGSGLRYVKNRILPSPVPGRVLVWTSAAPDAGPQEIDAKRAPAATPALLARDAATGALVLSVGLDAVERAADALANGASLVSILSEQEHG
jgi:hypothetical protein